MTHTGRAACTAVSLLLLIAPNGAAQEVSLRQYTAADGLAHNLVTDIFEDSRGFIWFATADGLTRFDGDRFATYRSADGLPRGALTALGESGGTLWIATRAAGVVHLAERPTRPWFAVRGESSGTTVSMAPMTLVTRVPPSLSAIQHRLFETRDNDSEPLVIRGTRSAVTDVTEDRNGNVWIATSGSGVFVVPSEPVVTYTAADELPDAHVLRVIESRDRRIYGVTRRGGVAQLRDDGIEAVPGSLFAPFHTIGRRILQDEDGAWWFWTNAGLFTAPGPGLSFTKARRSHEARPAPPAGQPFVDSRGWTWTALRGTGVSVCRARTSAAPACADYTKAEGVGHTVMSIAEDAFGRVYVGTRKGLLRFDASAGAFETVPSDRRLARASVTDCMRDSRGRMWIATTSGVFLVIPRRPRAAQPSQVYVTSLHADGEQIAAPPRGAVALAPLAFDTGGKTVRVEYVVPGLHGNDAAFYQHRLAGLHDEWSAATQDRSVTYSRLRPGSYKFQVRSVLPSGGTGDPASIGIEVRQTAWARWWWALGGAAVLLLAGRSLRHAQRAHRRRDLSCVPLRMLGSVEQQPEHRGRNGRAADGSRLAQR